MGPARDKIRDLYVQVFDREISVDEAMNETDKTMEGMVGEDNKLTDPMPARWNPALKKQFVNFRNHLRREIRHKYRGIGR